MKMEMETLLTRRVFGICVALQRPHQLLHTAPLFHTLFSFGIIFSIFFLVMETLLKNVIRLLENEGKQKKINKQREKRVEKRCNGLCVMRYASTTNLQTEHETINFVLLFLHLFIRRVNTKNKTDKNNMKRMYCIVLYCIQCVCVCVCGNCSQFAF